MSRFIFHVAHGNYFATAASHTFDLQCCWYPQQLLELNEIQEPRNGHFKLLVCVEHQLLPVFSPLRTLPSILTFCTSVWISTKVLH